MATATAAPASARERAPAWLPPLLFASLVVPSLAITPVLWVAVAAEATAGSGVAAQCAGVTGLLLAMAGGSGARAYALAHRERVRTVRRQEALAVLLCGAGVALAALTVAVADLGHVAWLAAGVTAVSVVPMAGLALRSRITLITGVVAVNVVWALDVVWLILLALDALLGDVCGARGCVPLVR